MKMKDAAKAAKEKSADFVALFKNKGGTMLHEEKIQFETLDDPGTVKAMLLHVVDGIDRGRIILASDEEELVFYPGSLIKLSIKGKRTHGTSKIKMSLSWSRLEDDKVGLEDEDADEDEDE
ncbi:MAG: amphi-Trp domain-containing protein [Desulfovibrionaceae bacterium]